MRYSVFGYLIGEGFRNVFKNKKSTIASIIIMCATMFVFGIFFLVGENVNHITKTIEEQQGMEVFIYDEATETQTTELGNQIRSMNYVNTVTYKTKEEALDQMKRMFKDKKGYLETYEGEGNPFKASYVVTLTDLTKLEEVQSQIEQSPIVANIQTRPDTVNALIQIADGIKLISIIILVILILISIFIITNTIKLTVHARRKEISIMKYVGATNSFIRWPFMVEGIIIGVTAALLSVFFLGIAYNYVIGQTVGMVEKIQISLLQFSETFNILIIIYLVLGIGIGTIGSAISMRKYLEV